MASGTSLYLVAAAALDAGRPGVAWPARLLAVVAFAVVLAGGWLGGTLVFTYGIRVDQAVDKPAAEALRPGKSGG